jgi:hypothetical protein
MNNKNNIKDEKIRKLRKDKSSTEFATYVDFSNDQELLSTTKLFKQKEYELKNNINKQKVQ